jgi:hypothetical protein
MKFVKVDWDPGFSGFNIDPSAYKEELEYLLDQLPAGARKFASDPGHYSFSDSRCVKDLQLAKVRTPIRKSDTLEIQFSPNQWKHDHGLEIKYFAVTRFEFHLKRQADWMCDEAVLMDEVLPCDGGCSHEIELSDSRIYIESEDMVATWKQV